MAVKQHDITIRGGADPVFRKGRSHHAKANTPSPQLLMHYPLLKADDVFDTFSKLNAFFRCLS